MFKTRCNYRVHGFKGGAVDPYPDFILPQGLRCAYLFADAVRNIYRLDEYPPGIFPEGSSLLHDAKTYGIRILGEFIEGDQWQFHRGLTVESLTQAMADHLNRVHVFQTKVTKQGELALLGFQNGAYVVQIGATVTVKNDPEAVVALWDSL